MTWWWFVQPLPLTSYIDYGGGTSAVYVGETQAASGVSLATLQGRPVWRIRLLTYDGNGNVTNVQFSPNYSTFGDIASNRASITYT